MLCLPLKNQLYLYFLLMQCTYHELKQKTPHLFLILFSYHTDSGAYFFRTKTLAHKNIKKNRQFAWNDFDCSPRCIYTAAAAGRESFHDDWETCHGAWQGYSDYAETWEQCSKKTNHFLYFFVFCMLPLM